MDLELKGKSALVTGSTAGIGLAIAAVLAREGAEVIVNGRTEERVENAVRAGLAGVAVTAGSTIIAAPMEVVAAADRANIFVAGVGEVASP